MIPLTPRMSLLVLLGLAAVILGGGLRLARNAEIVRIDRDREGLRDFADHAQMQLQRLDALYESHLERLARTLPNDAFVIRREADRIVGIRQYSLLSRTKAEGASDVHVLIAPLAGEHTPVPAFTAPRAGAARGVILLDEANLFRDGPGHSGWIDEPGKPLMFWLLRASDEVVVLMIDRPAVESAISTWLREWEAREWAAVQAEGGPDQLRTRGGDVLAGSGEAPADRADLLLPLRSRLGVWELASWDRRDTRVIYETMTMVVSTAVAILVAAFGFIVFGQQQRAAALAQQRVSFVNRVSHELRSPLTNIRLNVDLAADSIEDAPAEASRRLDLVQEEARRLGRLIDNVLTFSRHEQGHVQQAPRACVPESVLRAVVEQFAPSFARRALIVERSGNAVAACLLDPDALAQILSNLLSNVEKYVPGGVVEIAALLEEGMLTITVTDSGPGIPASAAERIFLPFERLQERVSEGSSGTGLGLAIARDLAMGMGGSLRLVPAARGACFELRVPAPPAGAIASVA